MPEKSNIKKIKKMFEERELVLLDTEYKNSKTKMSCIDKEGYKYYLTPNSIKDKRIKNFYFVSNNNPYSTENIKKYLSKKTKSILLNEYKNEKSELVLKCGCGNIFKTHWNHLYSSNKLQCDECGTKIKSDKAKLKEEDVLKILKSYNFSLIKYNNPHQISVQDIFGYKYLTSIYSIKNNNFHKCMRFNKNNPFTIENMKIFIEKNNIPLNICFEKLNSKIELKNGYLPCECTECGNIFYATWSQITLNKRYRCKKCTKRKSSLELEVSEYLKEKNIPFCEQKTFIGCKKKRHLPFDFYLYEHNCVIEVNGRQHYYEAKNFKKSLEERKEYDKIKKEYCYKNDITFLEIPYWSIKDKTYKFKIDNILE